MIKWARYSLAFLWISTSIISIFISPEIGFTLLAKTGINDSLANVFVYGGSLVDLLLGIWLITGWRIRVCCILQIIVIILYSMLLTIIEPSFWIHPFGPITKNIPILILIGILYQSRSKVHNDNK